MSEENKHGCFVRHLFTLLNQATDEFVIDLTQHVLTQHIRALIASVDRDGLALTTPEE